MATMKKNPYPIGSIRIWNDQLDLIPVGWQLCDGTNGTPAMIDRAVVGAGNRYSHKQVFGANSSTPLITVDNHIPSIAQMSAHSHPILLYSRDAAGSRVPECNGHSIGRYSSTQPSGNSEGHNHGATSSAVDTRQLSVAVYWIMRIF